MLSNQLFHFLQRHLFLACGLSVLCIHAALTDTSTAATLWHQGLDPSVGTAVADQEFPDSQGSSIYVVSDVTFDSAVRIDKITVPFSDQAGDWPTGAANAILNIFPVDTALDTEDATSGKQVPVTISPQGTYVAHNITATNLSIELPSGSYWIGLTPILEGELYGQEFHLRATTSVGQLSHVSNPGGRFDHSALWIPGADLGADFQDAAITVFGSEIAMVAVPEPSAAFGLLLLQFGFLVRRRR